MELENSQNNAWGCCNASPCYNLGEYEMWEIRIKQYFQIQDYALWEVIENGNSWVPIPVTATETGPSTGLKMTVPSTAEEKICKKNDVKARSLLLMALPNEHQLTFDQYVDAQSMFAAIKARFGGNEATKKTQKALLKQQYENFNASSSESLDSIFNRLQKLVSRLAILGVVTPPEDLNVKFLRSLPSEWDTHVVVWMNKPDFDTMGLDDLYNNFKIVEQKVKRSTGAINDEKNLAFLTTSGASSTNNINTVNPEVSTGTTKVNTASTEISTASFSDATNQGSSSKAVRIEDASEKAMCAIDVDSEVTNDKSCSKSCLKNYEALKKLFKEEKEGFEFKIAKFEKSAKDLDQLLANQHLLDLFIQGLREFKQPKVNEYGPRDSSVKPTTGCDKEQRLEEKKLCPANHVREEEPKKARENNGALIIEDWVSDDEDDVESIPKVEKKTVIPTATKKEFVKPEKPVRRSVSCPNVHKHMAPRAVLMKTGLKTVNTARPVNTVRSVNTGRPFSTARSFNTVRPSYTAHPKSTVHCARPRTYFQNQAQSTVHRPFYKRTALTKRSYNQRFNTGRQNVNTVRARGFNDVKPSTCWVWKPIKPNGASLSNSQLNDKGFVDSGCSRHMTGNIAHLLDFSTWSQVLEC
ncbi:hypothetical protein Tco_1354595 [Tanacetum coccineum]